MLKNLNFVLFTFLLFVSCSQQDSNLSKVETAFEKSLQRATGKNVVIKGVYVVMPRAGCSGCISTAEKMMLEKLEAGSNEGKIKFILTDFDSRKTLLARFGDLSGYPNVMLDPENIFSSNLELKSIYPKLYFFQEGKLTKVAEISPEQDGLAMLNLFLNSKT